MMFVSWSGVFSAAIETGGPVAFAMGTALIGLLAATTFALILGAERKARRLVPAVALSVPPDDRAAAA
jgi:hypothetical protein